MLNFIPANAQHIGSREEQQDSFAFSDPAHKKFVSHGGLLAVVADGMGGLANGGEASRAAVFAFQTAYGRKTPKEDIGSALRRSLQEANAAVLNVAGRSGDGTGTTLVAAVLHNSSLHWIAVGDSRLYLLRGGQLARINKDHNQLTEYWSDVALGRRERSSAISDPEGGRLTSHLGLASVPFADYSIRPFPLMDGDLAIACTDGVYRAIPEQEMIETFRAGSPDRACEAIEASTLSKQRRGQDNLTIIAVQCRSDQVPAAKPPKQAGKFGLIAVLMLEMAAAIGLCARLAITHLPAAPTKKEERAPAAPPKAPKPVERQDPGLGKPTTVQPNRQGQA
jgi:protein phosphatase